MKGKSDSLKVRQLETKVTACQSELLHLSVEQYFEIRDILRNKKAVVWKTKRLEVRFLKTLKNNE